MPAEHLVLEITVMSDPTRTVTMLERLADMGVRLSIDDYCTGHSSLAYLRRAPRARAQDRPSLHPSTRDNADDDQIVSSTIDLAHSLGLRRCRRHRGRARADAAPQPRLRLRRGLLSRSASPARCAPQTAARSDAAPHRADPDLTRPHLAATPGKPDPDHIASGKLLRVRHDLLRCAHLPRVDPRRRCPARAHARM
jgi:predicted signal transduction protein with EAL and GGDEF domain